MGRGIGLQFKNAMAENFKSYFFFCERTEVRAGHFFFQAEDGIRDADVTGVQTCALPISPELPGSAASQNSSAVVNLKPTEGSFATTTDQTCQTANDSSNAGIGRASCR